MGEDTTIPCLKTTRERIESLGKKGEKWDELLNRIADKFEETKEFCDK